VCGRGAWVGFEVWCAGVFRGFWGFCRFCGCTALAFVLVFVVCFPFLGVCVCGFRASALGFWSLFVVFPVLKVVGVVFWVEDRVVGLFRRCGVTAFGVLTGIQGGVRVFAGGGLAIGPWEAGAFW